MNALTIFIRRPVLATMVTLLFLVFGFFSYQKLGVDLMPKVEVPVVTVTTIMRGASPEEVETLLSKPVEEAVNAISGIDELSSYSSEGVSRVVIRFVLEKPIDEAVQDVRDKIATVVQLLPKGIDQPIVQKIDFDAMAVLTVAISGSRDLKELSEIARLTVKQSLETVDGVGSVTPIGTWKRAINVVLDLEKLEAYKLSVAQVKAALTLQNVEIPSGRIDRDTSEQTLRTLARVESVEDFGNIIVAQKGIRQVRLGDIAKIEDSVEEPRNIAKIWNKGEAESSYGVALDIVKQSGRNTVEVIDRIKERLKEIEPNIPTGVKLSVISDQSIFIKRSLHELKLHLVLGGFLASLAVLLFMGSLRSTIIAAVAIPTSLISTFTLMHALGFTLNNMSLLGLTLSVGIVIDDAIVVLENIYRHMEEYKVTPFQAAIDGLKEIGLAVMATTTSLLVIFLPVAFMEGMIGRFFFEFALTVAFAIAVSLMVSFTLTPMLSANFLKSHHDQKSSKQNKVWQTVENAYLWMLRFALNYRLVMVFVAIGILLLVAPLIKALGKDFIPIDDRSEFQVQLTLPGSVSLKTAEQRVAVIEEELKQIRGVKKLLTTVGSSTSDDVSGASIYVEIVDLKERDYSQNDVMKEVRGLLKKYPDIRSSVNTTNDGGGPRGGGYRYTLTGPDLQKLMDYSDQLAVQFRQIPGFVDVDTSLATRKPEVRLAIDRKRAADLSITPSDIASTLRTMVGGEAVTKYREGSEQYDVWVRLDREDRSNAEIISRLPITSAKGVMIPVDQVVTISDGTAPARIDRFNRQRQVAVYANMDGIDLGKAGQLAEKAAKDLNLSSEYKPVVIGRMKMMADAMSNMLMAFGLAFIFMYIVLAAQFESFLHPVTILLSLPLTLPFALLSLLLLNESLNLYSLLGLFMLFGIVKKNGILQVDYTNTLRQKGLAVKEALMEANAARLRPILMTTITLIAGMIPIALGTGPGAASRASMAKGIIGGQLLSLLITLLIVPVGYSLFESAKKKLKIG